MKVFVYCLIFFLIIAGFTLAYILLRKREKKILDNAHQSQNLTQGIAIKYVKSKKNKSVEQGAEEKVTVQEEIPESPLRVKLRGLAKTISKIGYAGAILASLSYLFASIVVVVP